MVVMTGHDQGTQASGGFVLFGVTALSPFVFLSTFLLFGNRGLRPNLKSTSKVSLLAEMFGVTGLFVL